MKLGSSATRPGDRQLQAVIRLGFEKYIILQLLQWRENAVHDLNLLRQEGFCRMHDPLLPSFGAYEERKLSYVKLRCTFQTNIVFHQPKSNVQ
jgi:hypothetical protein